MASSESTSGGIPASSETSSGEAVEMETKTDLASQNSYNSDCDQVPTGSSRDTQDQPEDHPPISKHKYDQKFIIFCAIAVFIILMVLLLIICVLIGYLVYLQVKLNHVSIRIDQLEGQSNGSVTPTVGSVGFEEEDVRVLELSQRLSRLEEEVRENISSLWEELGQMQELHDKDIDEVKKNATNLITQFSKLLNYSLSLLSNKTQSSISQLNASVMSEVQTLKSHSLMVAMNISVLADHVTTLENRSRELEHNISLWGETLAAKVDTATREYRTGISSLAVNVSSNHDQLQVLHLSQVEQGELIEGVRSNVSALKHDLEQLALVTTNHTTTLSEIETDLLRMDMSHRAELQTLSNAQENLHSALNSTREEFNSSIATLENTITALDIDIAEKLTNLSYVQEDIREDLSTLYEKFRENVTALEVRITSLNESVLETNEKLQNVSDSQRDLEVELNVTRGTLLANVSSVEQKLREEIDLTHEQLQRNISSLQSKVRLDLVETRELLAGNVSVLAKSIELTKMDLNNTSSRLLNLTSLYGELQDDYLATKESFSVHNATVSSNVSLLFDLVHSVDRNHTLLIDSHSRALRDIESNASALTQQLQNVSQLQRSQDQKITSVNTSFSDQLTRLRETLSSKIDHQGSQLGTRIDDHVQSTEWHLQAQSQTLNSLGNRVRQLESGASTVLPLPLLIISIISFLTVYFI